MSQVLQRSDVPHVNAVLDKFGVVQTKEWWDRMAEDGEAGYLLNVLLNTARKHGMCK